MNKIDMAYPNPPEGRESLDTLLNELQFQQPAVNDEEAFIQSIMDSLPDLPQEETLSDDKVEKTSPYIIMLRTISSLAAAVVIGWFILLNVGGISSNDATANETEYASSYSSAYSDMNNYSTPQEAIKHYTERKSMDINKLISMYDGK